MARSLSKEKTHNKWDKDLPPILSIAPGDVVEIETRESSDGDITPSSINEDVEKADINKVHPLTGPIYIDGAKPRDTLEVKIIDVEPDVWGWSCITRGLGYLKDSFRDPYLVLWKIDKKEGYAYSEALQGIRIPLNPFCGVMGVPLPEPGKHSTFPPSEAGGNMDVKYLTAGSPIPAGFRRWSSFFRGGRSCSHG